MRQELGRPVAHPGPERGGFAITVVPGHGTDLDLGGKGILITARISAPSAGTTSVT